MASTLLLRTLGMIKLFHHITARVMNGVGGFEVGWHDDRSPSSHRLAYTGIVDTLKER